MERLTSGFAAVFMGLTSTFLVNILTETAPTLPRTNNIVDYFVLEELPPNRLVGDLFHDFNFEQLNVLTAAESLRFVMLMQPPPDRRYFSVNETTGIIRTTHRIDREAICPSAEECLVKFDVAVKAVQHFQIIKVWVEIVDINDNIPTFPESRMVQLLSESARVKSGFSIPQATDADSKRNSVVRYDLMPPDGKFRLNIQSTAGSDGDVNLSLVIVEKLDHEVTDRYQMIVYATDGGEPALTGSLQIEIMVLDANDNHPNFDHETYELHVQESAPIGSVLVQVRATDRDSGLNGAIRYEFSKHTAYDYGSVFELRHDSGKIILKQSLDYETNHLHILSITANDRGPDSTPGHTTVIIHVDDVNDNPPRIQVNSLQKTAGDAGKINVADKSSYSSLVTCDENSIPGTFVAHIFVTDDDGTKENNNFRCVIDDDTNFRLQEMFTSAIITPATVSSASSAEFKLLTGNITFDRELREHYQVSVICFDIIGGNDGKRSLSLTSSVVLQVQINDQNDNSPTFGRESPYVVSIPENGLTGSEILRIDASDADIGPNGQVSYSIETAPGYQNARQLFSIDNSTGAIKTVALLDHELTPVIEFFVVAADGGLPSRSATARVKIVVLNVDDELPHFTDSFYSFLVLENEPAGTEVGWVSAVDRDGSPFDNFVYSLESRVSHVFSVEPSTGLMTTRITLDREQQEMYQFFVWSRSVQQSSHVSSAAVTVRIADVNDNRPHFRTSNETLTVSSYTPPGHCVVQVTAIDHDASANADMIFNMVFISALSSYPSRNQRFNINRKTGEVTVSNQGLDDIEYDEVLYMIEVRAVENEQGFPDDAVFLRFVITAEIPFTNKPDGNKADIYEEKLDEQLHGNILSDFGGIISFASSNTPVLRLEDEGLITILAIALAVILVAITVVVVIFACIRSADRGRNTAINSTAGSLPTGVSAQSKHFSEKPITCARVKSGNQHNLMVDDRFPQTNVRERSSAIEANSMAWMHEMFEESSAPSYKIEESSKTTEKPVVVFIKDSSADISCLVMDADEERERRLGFAKSSEIRSTLRSSSLHKKSPLPVANVDHVICGRESGEHWQNGSVSTAASSTASNIRTPAVDFFQLSSSDELNLTDGKLFDWSIPRNLQIGHKIRDFCSELSM